MTKAAPHQEIELKRLLLGDGAADKLAARLGPAREERRQVNYVFDTDDRRLHGRRYAVRLRFEDEKAMLTAKGPSRDLGASTASRAEAEAWVDREQADAILSGRLDPVATLRQREGDPAYAALWAGLDEARGGAPLRRLGSFANVRRVFPVALPSGLRLELELDRTSFSAERVDDEVEIELSDEGAVDEVEAWLEAKAREAGVTTAPSTPKVARFYAFLDGP
ncbi:MAG TPA: CYTH domain-containing protein [Polyangiaceae bacterium]|nr:CYTH domain-containing protein [Polyangiaceae bacterium]